MNHYLLLLFFCCSLLTFGQGPQSSPGFGVVTGLVVDIENQQPIGYATVTLFTADEHQLVTGGLTEENGQFTIKEVPAGSFIAEVSFIGYDSHSTEAFTISKEQAKHQIPTVGLGVNAESLDAVVVEGEAPAVRYDIDKKVYDVSKIKAAEGGSAKDVLEQIPSITINSDQGIQLRGSDNVRVLVNGKPSSFDVNTLLQQIPQKNIKDIEIITNPSAKYDAEGEVGIINIILKDNDLQGFTGGINVSWGTENKWNLGGNVAYKVKKWNLTSSYNFNQFKDNFYRDINRSTPNEPTIDQITDEDRNFRRQSHFARFGVDYYIDDANTLFFNGTYNPSNGKNDAIGKNENVFTRLFNGSDFIPYQEYDYNRISNGRSDNDGYAFNGSFQHVFDGNMKHNLFVDVNYNNSEEKDKNNYKIDQFDAANGAIVPGFFDDDGRNRKSKTLLSSIDYTNPFDGQQKLELGAKATLDDVDERFDVNYNNTFYAPSSGDFTFKQNVYAGYMTYEKKVSQKVGLKGGLRAEYTDVNSVASGGQSNEYIDDYLEWFPSASASLQANERLQLNASYSRRISRPSGRRLNPFADRTDPNNLFVGNNTLRPSFTNSIELGLNRFWETVSLDGSTYYRNVKDQIQFRSDYNEETNINEVSFYNLTEQHVLGAEAAFNYQPKKLKWYSLALSGNYNYSRVKQNDSDVVLKTNKFSLFSGNIRNNFRFQSGWGGQLNLNYQGPLATYIGEVDAMWGINANISRNILDGKGSIYARGNDLFNTFGLNADISNAQNQRRIQLDWPSQMAFIGFNYNFGNLKSPGRRKLQRREEREGGDEPNIGL